jgi:hypothetical protein
MDEAEAALGAAGDPLYTASLGDMEQAAAKATGCDKEKLKSDLRIYHEKLGPLGSNNRKTSYE